MLKVGRRAAGTLQAEYKGTITTGRVAGTGQDITTPNTGTVPWNGTGPAECVTRYLWTASGKAVKPSEVRVLLPELPNGGETSYRQYTGHATSYGLFETDAGGKLQNVRGKLTVSILYRRVLTGEGVPPAVAKAPLTLERTITFDTTSGQSFAPPHPVTPRGGTLRLTLKLERDNFLVCNPKDVGTLILTDEDGPNKAFRIGGFDTTCLAGGKAQSGAAAGEDLVDLRNASSISVVIRKRA